MKSDQTIQDNNPADELIKIQNLLDGLLLEKQNQHDKNAYRLKLAETWHNLGILQREFRQWEDTEHALITAYELYQQLGVKHVERQAIVCFDLALLKSERLKWKEAEDYFRFSQDMFQNLGANDIRSPLADELADTWLHWGILKRRQHKWYVAEKLFKKAEQLYLRLGASDALSPYADELAETWMNIAIVWHAQQKTDKADSLMQQAESLYLQLGANNFASPHADELAETWLQFGVLLQNCRQFDQAKHKMQLAHDLYSALHAGQSNSPYCDELAETQLHLTLLYNESAQWPEFNETLQRALRLYSTMTHFSGDFVAELTLLSSIATRSPIAVNILFHELSSLLAKWQTIQIGDDELFQRTQKFWHYWISFALEHNNYSLLLDILGASQGQRLLEIVQNNQQAYSQTTNTDIQKFLHLQQQLRQLDLEILSVQRPLPSQTTPYLRQKKQRLKVTYRKVRNEWLTIRQSLIKQGNSLFTPLPILRAKDIQDCLKQHEAIVFVVSLNVFGVEDGPRLLLVQCDRIESIKLPILNQAVKAMNQLNNSLINQGRSLSLRLPGNVKLFNDEFNTTPPESNLGKVKWAMQQFNLELKSILNSCVNSVHIISQGPFHNLPWQYDCAVPATAFYPGLHAFWQRRHSAQDLNTPIYPSQESPLCLISNASDDEPMNRLYYLPTEIEFIRHIWGEELVETFDCLPAYDGKPRLIFLLGHGSFDRGNAQFALKQSKLSPQSLIAYQNPIYALGVSSCLLANHEDIANEPFGFFSQTASRRELRFGVGAIVPVDDLSTSCLSLLFHFYWREAGQPNKAMSLALDALSSGLWPEEVKMIFKKIFTTQLPFIFNELQQDEVKGSLEQQALFQQRCENIIQPWTRHTAYYIKQYKTLIESHDLDKQQRAVEILLDGFLENLSQKQHALAYFLPFWLWG